jgi:hypothetical protein
MYFKAFTTSAQTNSGTQKFQLALAQTQFPFTGFILQFTVEEIIPHMIQQTTLANGKNFSIHIHTETDK